MTSQAQPTPLRERINAYLQLTRVNKPIGILLLLWPTYWALLSAGNGRFDPQLWVIFTLGVILTRSAGCVINDFADRKVDGHVERTRARPLVTGLVSAREAIKLFIALMLLAFLLVLMTNTTTVLMSFGALALAFCYPFMKRYTHLPQVFLGAAFSWAIPMAFTAHGESLTPAVWLIFFANLLWTVAYDTQYAMVDRNDDLKIGIKSTAILFGRHDRLIIGLLQLGALLCLSVVGILQQLGPAFFAGLLGAAGLFAYQQALIRQRQRPECFKAFLNNHYVGMIIFAGWLGETLLS